MGLVAARVPSTVSTITAQGSSGMVYSGTIAGGMLTWERADYVRVP